MIRTLCRHSLPLVIAWLQVCLATVAHAQSVHEPSRQPQAEGISLNFPENVELKVFVQYVSKRLGINILYDEQVISRRITLQSPENIPESSLLGLLESVLAMKGMALVDADEPGWKRIVPVANLTAISRSPSETDKLLESPDVSPSAAVTGVFVLKNIDPKRADEVITPFLTQPGANSVTLEGQPLLIVTDFASNMRRIRDLIHLIDQPTQAISMRFLPAKHQDAAALAQDALKMMRAKLNAESKTQGAAGPPADGLDIIHDERTNQVVIVGTQKRVAEAVDVIQSLDVSLGQTTKVYQFSVVSPSRVDRMLKDLVGPLAAKRLYRSAVDRDSGTLIVTTTDEIHQRLESLKTELDVAGPESQSPLRVYKLFNATAADVLDTIRMLEGDGGEPASTPARSNEEGAQTPQQSVAPNAQTTASDIPSLYPSPEREQTEREESRPAVTAVKSDRATITADVNTNSIIVIARPEVQRVYERLIEILDRRRPQVLIEITIATINTTDDYSLGVEFSRVGSAGQAGILTFSSFGLSTASASGGLTLIPGLGFNGAVVDSDVADIIVHALKQDSRSKVVSAPKILVNDNATGTLTSIREEPYTSVNASDTVATTSFAGFAEAGTTIEVTPHISEGDHLTLEYDVSLNSFTGEGINGIPPPRKTDSIKSHVTVPDGSTIIVGGLSTKDQSKNVDSIPILGEIPLLKHLVSTESVRDSQTTLFVFIRPIILRDDEFEGLKYLSERQVRLAGLPGDYPASEPLVLK